MSRYLSSELREFAVKEHSASSYHFDLMFYLWGDTVFSLFSKYPPHLDPTRPMKFTRTNDHKRSSLYLEHIIPPGMYGAGPKATWDKGYFRVLGKGTMYFQLGNGHLEMEIYGERLRGKYLLKWVGPTEKDWVLIKLWDEFVDALKQFPNVLTPDKIRELERKLHPQKDHSSMELFKEFA